jgi:hypothetical protein
MATFELFLEEKIDFVRRLMENTETLIENGKINENKYIECMNRLKTIYEFYTSEYFKSVVGPQIYASQHVRIDDGTQKLENNL